MAINSKTFKRIRSLHRDGVSLELTLTMIISLSETPAEASKRIIELLTPPKQFIPLNEIQLDGEGSDGP